MAGILWVVDREDCVVGRSDDLHSIPHFTHLGAAATRFSGRRMWETLGENWSCCRRCDTEAARWRTCGEEGLQGKQETQRKQSSLLPQGPCSNCPGRAS